MPHDVEFSPSVPAYRYRGTRKRKSFDAVKALGVIFSSKTVYCRGNKYHLLVGQKTLCGISHHYMYDCDKTWKSLYKDIKCIRCERAYALSVSELADADEVPST